MSVIPKQSLYKMVREYLQGRNLPPIDAVTFFKKFMLRFDPKVCPLCNGKVKMTENSGGRLSERYGKVIEQKTDEFHCLDCGMMSSISYTVEHFYGTDTSSHRQQSQIGGGTRSVWT